VESKVDCRSEEVERRLQLSLGLCVDYLGSKVIASMLDSFAECVFDGGVVAIHKVFVDELHCRRGFAWRSPFKAWTPSGLLDREARSD